MCTLCVYGVLFVPVFIREASKCWWKCFGSEGRGGDGRDEGEEIRRDERGRCERGGREEMGWDGSRLLDVTHACFPLPQVHNQPSNRKGPLQYVPPCVDRPVTSSSSSLSLSPPSSHCPLRCDEQC